MLGAKGEPRLDGGGDEKAKGTLGGEKEFGMLFVGSGGAAAGKKLPTPNCP